MMKRLMTTSLLAFGLLVAVGCSNTSPPGGKPTGSHTGTTSNSNAYGAKSSQQFEIKSDDKSISLKQGETKKEEVRVDRGKDFKEGVKLSVEAPTGIKATLSKSMVAASDPEKVELSITADKNAAIGEHELTITGTPDTGTATTLKIKVNVKNS